MIALLYFEPEINTSTHIHKIRVESRALLISGPPSRVRKGRFCKVEILICAWNAREKFVIHEANISKTNPVTLLF
jgi:hypothetical protein